MSSDIDGFILPDGFACAIGGDSDRRIDQEDDVLRHAHDTKRALGHKDTAGGWDGVYAPLGTKAAKQIRERYISYEARPLTDEQPSYEHILAELSQ